MCLLSPAARALLKEVLDEPSFLFKPFFFEHKLALGSELRLLDLNCVIKCIGGGAERGVGFGLCKSSDA